MTLAKKPRAETLAYFEGCFPTQVVISFDREQAMLWAPAIKEHKRGRANHCVVEVKHVPPKQKARVKSRLARMVKADGEKWNAIDFNFVAYLWERERKGEPAAFLTFNVGTDERTRSGRVDWVQFTADLAYTRRASRKRGLGSFLAAAFEDWLSQCRVYGNRIRRGGVYVSFNSEFYSEGGGSIGEILHAHFAVLKDMKGEIRTRALGWDIRDVDFNAGF
jgi:GNAT superfamily N-acetyltransferase